MSVSVIRAALCASALMGALSGASAQQQDLQERQFKAGDIVITAPWARATPKGAKVAGGYMKITNAGKQSDRLVGGSFALAGRFEVHEMSVSDGVMRMRHLAQGLEIKAGETVELKPGAYHLMFMQLREGVATGKLLKGTLVFERAGTVHIEYVIAPIGARTPPQADGPAVQDHSGHKHH